MTGGAGLFLFTFLLVTAALPAQWLNYPTPGIPRTADGIALEGGLRWSFAGAPPKPMSALFQTTSRARFGFVKRQGRGNTFIHDRRRWGACRSAESSFFWESE